jgi:hypothetical protein
MVSIGSAKSGSIFFLILFETCIYAVAPNFRFFDASMTVYKPYLSHCGNIPAGLMFLTPIFYLRERIALLISHFSFWYQFFNRILSSVSAVRYVRRFRYVPVYGSTCEL